MPDLTTLSPPLHFHTAPFIYECTEREAALYEKANVNVAVIQSGALTTRGGGGVLVNGRAWQPV